MTAVPFTEMSVSMSTARENEPEGLGQNELELLAAAAGTAEEHRRIAEYYRAKAADYLARANVHQAMVALYEADPWSVLSAREASMVAHCGCFAETLREQAVRSEELAEMHERLASPRAGGRRCGHS
jgi:hypothetical protein